MKVHALHDHNRNGNDTENSLRVRIRELELQVKNLLLVEKEFRDIIEHATEVIFKLDKFGNFIFVSKEFERMLQITNEEIRGKHFTTIVHPEDLKICVDTFQELEQNGRANNSIDFRVRQKNGDYKWVTCSAILRFNDDGTPSHTIGMAHEFTRLYHVLQELQASETALRFSEERYRRLFEALSEGAVLLHKSKTVIAVNRSAKKIFGLPDDHTCLFEDFENNYNWIYEDGSHFPLENHPSSITLSTGLSLKEVVMGVQKKGESILWISINTEPIYYSGNKGKPDAVIASFIDITQAKKDREDLIHNQQLLAMESQRYIKATKAVAQAVVDAQEKERAEIGVELHDNVNQILSTSKLYLDLAALNEKDRVDLIRRSSEGLTGAISEIRKICHSLVPASLNDLGLIASVEDLAESVNSTRSLKLSFYYRGEIESIPGKSKLVLFRIIQEQVTNVLKHAEATRLVIELVMDTQNISVSISDNGKGFDMEGGKIRKGVGLHNIANRAELLNGKVNIITSPGKGCKLNILIPV